MPKKKVGYERVIRKRRILKKPRKTRHPRKIRSRLVKSKMMLTIKRNRLTPANCKVVGSLSRTMTRMTSSVTTKLIRN